MTPSGSFNRVDFLLDVAHTVINRNPELSAKDAARKVIEFVDEIEKAMKEAGALIAVNAPPPEDG